MLTVLVILAATTFVTAILSAMGKCPGWVPSVTIGLYALVQCLPEK